MPNPKLTPEEEHMKRVLAGHKGNVNNPNASTESKDHSIQVLRENGIHIATAIDGVITFWPQVNVPSKSFSSHSGTGPSSASYNEPEFEDDDDDHFGSRVILPLGGGATMIEEMKHVGAVVAGLKSAIKNPKTSEKARENTKRKLQDYQDELLMAGALVTV